MRIDSISQLSGMSQKGLEKISENKVSFETILNSVMDNINQSEKADTADTIALLTGDVDDLHTSMISMEKADIVLQFTMQIRNKLLDSYNEIMRMQI